MIRSFSLPERRRWPIIGVNTNPVAAVEATEEIARFSDDYGARYPKAGKTLTKDQDKFPTYFGYPAERWPHLHTTNPIEATFATVKAQIRKAKGAGSRKAGLPWPSSCW
jgi:transposase-like protein